VFGTFATENLPSLPPPLFFDVIYNPSNVVLQVKSTTAVAFRSFTAIRAHGGITLRWRTGTEGDLLGFNVYRGQSGTRNRLNEHMIGARGLLTGHAYSFVDRHAARGSTAKYWLQVVDRAGGRSWYGPVRP
jgi:hypothetical protein